MMQAPRQANELSHQDAPWWVQRWLELLDSYRFKKRLERARNYAKQGNVLTIEFDKGKVFALVQGTEVEPYQIQLSLDAFSDEDWDFIIDSLYQKAIFSAQLLAGKMPDEIESIFVANGLNLFPFTLTEVHSRCSCPDKANPCKHIGAIYYQLADRFREDPFVIFQLRGRSKTEILRSLRQLRREKISDLDQLPFEAEVATENKQSDPSQANQSPLNLETFWQYDEPLEADLVAIIPPLENKTPLDFLGKPPLPYEEAEAFAQQLQRIYQIAREQAVIEGMNQ